MRKVFIALALLALVALTFAREYESYSNYSFDNFLHEHSREYAAVNGCPFELAKRRVIFDANMSTIVSHNKRYELGLETWWMAPNQFADLTQDEFETIYLNAKQSPYAQERRLHRLRKFSHADKLFAEQAAQLSIDWFDLNWVEKGAVSPVKNQGSCGSCWAFAAATALESRAILETGIFTEVSTQQLTSCTPNPRKCGGSGGCEGSTADLAYAYIRQARGITSEQRYPYRSGSTRRTETCEQDKVAQPVLTIDGHVNLIPNNKTDLLLALKSGPVSVSMAASNISFYGGGVFNGCTTRNNWVINHAVVLVGTATLNGEKAYLIRNSWGKSWGLDGNIYVAAYDTEPCGTNPDPWSGSACEDDPNPPTHVCGECGILSESDYPFGIRFAV